MKSNKLTVAVLIFALTMSGCIAGGDTDKVQDKSKKANDKVVFFHRRHLFFGQFIS